VKIENLSEKWRNYLKISFFIVSNEKLKFEKYEGFSKLKQKNKKKLSSAT
jgi:hypothetical protein